jgi:hypothetical protein
MRKNHRRQATWTKLGIELSVAKQKNQLGQGVPWMKGQAGEKRPKGKDPLHEVVVRLWRRKMDQHIRTRCTKKERFHRNETQKHLAGPRAQRRKNWARQRPKSLSKSVRLPG